ncbi:MAG TPA: ATP-binding protein [Nitrospiria bacterium]|nr:ATP-binding protein [Nitrospiria bacterium]
MLSGKSIRIHVFREDSGKVIQAFFAPVHTARGTIIGRILVEDSSDGKSTPLGVVLWIYGVVAFGVIAYSVIRISPKGWSGKVSGGNTGLMIDAFHGLIAKLKEKEEELQRLKHSAEERAHEVENYNENILQSVTSGVITLDREMKITTINAAAESILCLKCDEALAKSGEGIFGEKSAVMLLLRKAASDGTIVSRQELELERASGERIWVGISISLLRDRRGSIIGTTLVFTDLTEIKKLQEQVEVKKRLTVLGEMSAWIAHEFRNYMGTILGLARLLSKGSSEGQQQAMVQSIIEELSAMDRLITELLSYGKKTELHLEAISLREFIGEVVQSFEAAGKCDRVGIRIDVPQGIPSVSIDPVLMRQALSNLIQNALESSGGALGGEIRITAWQRPSEVVLEISDNGEGIPREHLEKIFLPFFTTKEKGTGLGLALVHKIVMSHNGRIEARNREEGGASFALTLPICVTRDAWKPYSSSKIGKT